MFTSKDLTDGLVIAKKYTKSIQDAQDVLSKACEKAVLKKDQCKGKFSPWFRAIVRTTGLNHHRYDVVEVQFTKDTDEWLEVPSHSYQEVSDCDIILKNLTNKEKDIILSTYVNKIPQAQIADKYRVSKRTIALWRKDALEKLRRENV